MTDLLTMLLNTLQNENGELLPTFYQQKWHFYTHVWTVKLLVYYCSSTYVYSWYLLPCCLIVLIWYITHLPNSKTAVEWRMEAGE
jgi:hypothetical protein